MRKAQFDKGNYDVSRPPLLYINMRLDELGSESSDESSVDKGEQKKFVAPKASLTAIRQNLLYLRQVEYDHGNYDVANPPLFDINQRLDAIDMLCSPLSVWKDDGDQPTEIQVPTQRMTRSDHNTSMSSFDLSSLTRYDENAERHHDEFENGGTVLVSKSEKDALERARNLARSITNLESANAHPVTHRDDKYYDNKCIAVRSSAALLLLSVVCLCLLGGGGAESRDVESVLSKAVFSRNFRLALAFSIGAAVPLFVHFSFHVIMLLLPILISVSVPDGQVHVTSSPCTRVAALQQRQGFFINTACGVVLVVSVLVPHIILFALTTDFGREMKQFAVAALYTSLFGFQYCVFAACSCCLLAYNLPGERLVFRCSYIVTFCGLFSVGIVLYVASINYTVAFPYSQIVYASAGILTVAGIMYLAFLREFVMSIFAVSGREKFASLEEIWACGITNIGIVVFLVLDLSVQAGIRSVRTTDFNVFNVCWHVATKTLIMLTIGYTLPLKISDILAARARKSVESFVGALANHEM